VLSEIAESEDLSTRGWLLLIFSSIVAGLCISVYYLDSIQLGTSNSIFGVLIPILFCLFYGFDLAWGVAANKKEFTSKRSFITMDNLSDPDFQRAIRIMGYSSVVLIFSSLVILTGYAFYPSDVSFSPTGILDMLGVGYLLRAFFPIPAFLDPLVFPYTMFLNPLDFPIVFFLIWQTIIFYYGYTIHTEEKKRKTIFGLFLGFIIFNLFWFVAIIAAFLTVLFVGGLCSGGGNCFWGGGKKKENKSSNKRSSSVRQPVIHDE
jgi:hypothetical protein